MTSYRIAALYALAVVACACSSPGPDAGPADDAASCEAQRNLALALFREGNLDESVAAYEGAASGHPCEESLLALALAYGSAEREQEAEQAYRRLLRIDENHTIALISVANSEFKVGRSDQAMELYRKAITAEPDNLMAHYHLAEVLSYVGREQQAYPIFGAVLKLRPSSALEVHAYYDAVYQMGAMDLERGNLDKAERKLLHVLESQPNHPHARYVYGKLMLELGREDEAQQAFDEHMRRLAERKNTGQMATNE